MQQRSHTARNLIIALIAIGLVLFAGYAYIKRDRIPDTGLLTSSASGQEQAVEGDLLSALFELKRLKLDDSLFRDPIWSSLTDFSKTLAPETPGRPNPFAPFAGSTTTSSAF
ncbi:MAG: hypothetical protein HZA81_02780 [Candidatus Taylorbacteria bacterium]|nr:hypothetical protein [Candidatus Taylorbacteria bacterium]